MQAKWVTAKCESCGNCVEACQFSTLSLENGKLVLDGALCMGCGACISRCDKGAHSLVLDERKGIPLEILKLIEKKDKSQQYVN